MDIECIKMLAKYNNLNLLKKELLFRLKVVCFNIKSSFKEFCISYSKQIKLIRGKCGTLIRDDMLI